MKFSSSVIAIGALQRDVDVLAINSMAKHNPDTALSFDDFLKKITDFHSPTTEGEAKELVSLVTNANQPVYDFKDLEVQHTKRLDDNELANALDQDIEL
ncbi:hypothetical protein [Vibrio agarivorans]|uniref:hypothetical protein n=1 Tax=Vibrio agarivorans TaxID=153622 RepID=UPI0025B410CB|nr:hypothetical protein [Vibrio agarivorans]MDN3661094.1 hypothetical protein [Vibrio agarivorans]